MVHVYWAGATKDVSIDNGTLNTVIAINQEKKNKAETKLKLKLAETTTTTEKSRKKRSFGGSEGNGLPVVALKVY